MTALSFVCLGQPIPQGSARAINNHVTASNGHVLKPWRLALGSAAISQAILEQIPQFTGPVVVRVMFCFRRPKHHYRTGRNAALLRDSAPPYPISRGCGDLDKLQRALGDALVDVSLLLDDDQIVKWRSSKAWCDSPGALAQPGAIVEVEDLPPP